MTLNDTVQDLADYYEPWIDFSTIQGIEFLTIQ